MLPPRDNRSIAQVLREIGEYLEMDGVQFKPRAYEKAAEAVEAYGGDIQKIYGEGGGKALRGIPGVGASIAEKIEEFLEAGRVKEHEELKKKTPVNLGEFRAVEGVGPKSLKKLYEALGVRTLKDLEAAARAGKVRGLEGFGEKKEAHILKSIEFAKKSGGRFLLGEALPAARALAERLRSVKGASQALAAGSVRRMKETIGDVDLLVAASDPQAVMDYAAKMPGVARVLAHGETKSSVELASGLQVDVRVVPEESWGAALNYFTGSKDHNVALRERAIKLGLKLNEYGLYRGAKAVAGKTEEELYKALKLDYIPPELREMTGEIEAAEAHKLPELLGYGDLEGDLQVQTNWTDGSASIEEMARAAMGLGRKYIAITDHTKRLAMTHGLDEKRIAMQWREIDAVNKKLKGQIKVLKGTECDILKDGTLDLPDSILSKLDVVGVSVHSLFNLSEADQTARIVRAIENPHVDILFHPTGRIIGKREAYAVDIEAVIKAAKRTGTVLETDALPERLDLNDEYVKRAVEAGVKLSIDSDAHAPGHLALLEYGVGQARRGWAEKKDIINAWPLEKMRGFLKEE